MERVMRPGAKVHWSTNYDTLKDVNVGSTLQLLQAGVASPFLKRFVYVSGGLITDKQIWSDEEARLATGYDQSKYVSERLVSPAATQICKSNTAFSIIKPGQIIGDVYGGVANTDDFLWRVVMGAVWLGAHPVESDASWLSISDVRHVGESILWHAAGKIQEHFMHNKTGVWVNDFWDAVEEQLELRLRPISRDEWTQLAVQDMAQEQQQHPLWPVQQFRGVLGIEVDGTHHRSQAGEMREVLVAVRQNIEYLRRKGFLETWGKRAITHKVMARTGTARMTRQTNSKI